MSYEVIDPSLGGGMQVLPLAAIPLHQLGKSEPKVDSKRIQFGDLLEGPLARPPGIIWNRGVTDFGMLANDKHGDCTIAGCGHILQIATLNTWGQVQVTDAETLDYYAKWCGYDPTKEQPDGTNPTDQGGNEIDVLNHWLAEGFGQPGHPLHKIIGYADPDVGDLEHVKQGVAMFATVKIGVALPVSVQRKRIWDGVPRAFDKKTWPGSWGGHDVTVIGYDDSKQLLYFISWGIIMAMTERFWHGYVDEAHVVFHNGWQYRPGFNVALLKKKLAELGKVTA